MRALFHPWRASSSSRRSLALTAPAVTAAVVGGMPCDAIRHLSFAQHKRRWAAAKARADARTTAAEECAQRAAAYDAAICDCVCCRRDVSVEPSSTSPPPSSSSKRDFLRVLEHQSFVHLVDGDGVFIPAPRCGFDDDGDDSVAAAAASSDGASQGASNEGSAGGLSIVAMERSPGDTARLSATTSGMGAPGDSRVESAELLARAVEDLLDARRRVHVLIAQDGTDHESAQLCRRISAHVRGVAQRGSIISDNISSSHDTAALTVIVVYLVGARRARQLVDTVVVPTQDAIASDSDVVGGAAVDVRSCLVCPPRSTQSVERTFYCVVELLAVLAQRLARRRLRWAVAAPRAVPRRRRLRRIQPGDPLSGRRRTTQLSVSVLSDHRHVWSNIAALHSESPDFELIRF